MSLRLQIQRHDVDRVTTSGAAARRRRPACTPSLAWAVAVLMLCLPGVTQASDLDEAQRDAITAIVFDSAITLRAKERQASKELRQLYERLDSVTGSALGEADKHRRELILKDRIIRELQATDRVYAAQIEGFKGSLQALWRAPLGAKILLEYQSGDKRAALAELERLIEARRQLRQAAAQTFYVADLRAEAALALDAADKGEVELAYAIRKLEALVVEEADQWRTWLTLFRFYFSDEQYEEARRCLTRASELLAGKETLATIFATYAELEMKIHDIEAEVAAKGIKLNRAEEFQRHHLNYVIAIENEEAETLLTMATLGEGLEVITGRLDARAKHPRSEVENALLAQRASGRDGMVCAALAKAPAVGQSDGVDDDVQRSEPRAPFINFALAQAVRDACHKHLANPSVALYTRHLAFVLERLGRLYYESNDRPMATLLYSEAQAIDRRMRSEHPSSLDLRRNLATSTFNLALAEETSVRWSDACAYLEAMSQDGRLMRRDQPFREAACRQARAAAEP